MTLEDLYHAQEKIKRQAELKNEQSVVDTAKQAQHDMELRQWQQTLVTGRFVSELQKQSEELDQQAKNLAMLDTDCALAIRALLIESATLKKVINYVRRTESNANY